MKDIEKTLIVINKVLDKAKENIEKIEIDGRFSSDSLLKKEIEENANKEIFDPKHE